MGKKIKDYKKLKDIINLKESETRIALFFSMVSCLIFYAIGVYKNVDMFENVIHDILICFLGGFIGMTGFSLSGMAIMLGLFDKKQVITIEKENGEGTIENIMSSYAFLAFLSAMNVFIFLITDILLSCEKKQLPVVWLIIYTFIICYLAFFDIFYAVSLVFNCISLFTISKIYSEKNTEQSISILANDIKADYILGILVDAFHISKEDVLNGLKNEASSMPKEIQDAVMKYFERQYK